MTRMRCASLNLSGVQSAGEWKRFVRRMEVLAREERVDVVLGQEHNLPPDRAADANFACAGKGFPSFPRRDIVGMQLALTSVLDAGSREAADSRLWAE